MAILASSCFSGLAKSTAASIAVLISSADTTSAIRIKQINHSTVLIFSKIPKITTSAVINT
ncbi:hypothetical protein D3C80_1871930 [compost metagenome]